MNLAPDVLQAVLLLCDNMCCLRLWLTGDRRLCALMSKLTEVRVSQPCGLPAVWPSFFLHALSQLRTLSWTLEDPAYCLNLRQLRLELLPNCLTKLELETQSLSLPLEPKLENLFPNLLHLSLANLTFNAWGALLPLPPRLESIIIQWEHGYQATIPYTLPATLPASLVVIDLGTKYFSLESRFWAQLTHLQVLKIACAVHNLEIFADFPSSLEELSLRVYGIELDRRVEQCDLWQAIPASVERLSIGDTQALRNWLRVPSPDELPPNLTHFHLHGLLDPGIHSTQDYWRRFRTSLQSLQITSGLNTGIRACAVLDASDFPFVPLNYNEVSIRRNVADADLSLLPNGIHSLQISFAYFLAGSPRLPTALKKLIIDTLSRNQLTAVRLDLPAGLTSLNLPHEAYLAEGSELPASLGTLLGTVYTFPSQEIFVNSTRHLTSLLLRLVYRVFAPSGTNTIFDYPASLLPPSLTVLDIDFTLSSAAIQWAKSIPKNLNLRFLGLRYYDSDSQHDLGEHEQLSIPPTLPDSLERLLIHLYNISDDNLREIALLPRKRLHSLRLDARGGRKKELVLTNSQAALFPTTLTSLSLSGIDHVGINWKHHLPLLQQTAH